MTFDFPQWLPTLREEVPSKIFHGEQIKSKRKKGNSKNRKMKNQRPKNKAAKKARRINRK